jgi:class 3 adenylate cyclase/tetratricopeptide (TPR) repeat protein
MRCPSCKHENRAGRKFCVHCGAGLEPSCPSCGAKAEPREPFCGQCGTELQVSGGGSRVSTNTQHSTPPTPGERRQLTMLFCDLVDSTRLAAGMDAEDWRELVRGYQEAAGRVVERFEGHVAQYLGDGLLVYFGWPKAHEDDVERAVRAALGIVDAVGGLRGEGPELAVRVGLHTGPVVVGEMGRGASRETLAMGDTAHVAARLQGIAEPDTVVITATTQRLVAGLFVVEDRGVQELKGIALPLQLYRVIQASAVRRRTHGAAARAMTPFVGRDDEMRLLLGRWERACESEGQVALVVGEPGIGKSRLVEEFRARIKDDTHLWIECAGDQFFENTPFYAVTQILDQGLGWHGDESREERVIQLERSLELVGMKLGEAVPLIAEMLNLPVPEKYPPLTFAPDQKRKRLLANLATWVFNAARLQPVVIVMEDLHWVDPSTLELQQILVEQAATAPLMLLYTARPEFRAPWPMRAHHAQITLSRLTGRQTRDMVAGVAARAALAKDVIDAVVKRTDGVPLFAEELTRLILEGDGRAVAGEIPATLHDSLMARLDRLGAAKEVAQVAAVIGREFSYELLQAVSPIPEDGLQSALEKLADAELIYARGIPPEATYQFKHSLVHDAAYEALLKSRRRDLHRRVAQTITEKFPAVAEAQPETLARHWTYSGDAEPAIAAWKKAGEAAEARRAFREAEEGYRQALAVLKTLPESPERDARELELAGALYRALLITKGYSATETLEAAGRSRALAEKGGSLVQLVLQAIGSFAAFVIWGDYASASALADQILDLAQREGSYTSLGFAHAAQVIVRFFRGDLVGVEEHFMRLSSFVQAAHLAQHPGTLANTLGFASLSAWMLGHADSARARIAQAIALAGDDKNSFDLAAGRNMESYLYRWLREPHHAADAATQALAISEQNGFPYYRDFAPKIIGWARAQLGKPGEGVALIRQSLASLAETGVRIDITNALTILAEAQALDGAIDDALITIEDALQANSEELVFQPNILRCRGELRLKVGQTELAEADFREAISLAQAMSAKTLELRATTSLGRLLQKQGKNEEARQMLAEIYGWFTEGFDTADLKDAKALLEELS